MIREANEEDYDAIYLLNKMWFYEGVSPFAYNPPKADFFGTLRHSSAFVAEIDGEIVGFLICKIMTAEHDNFIHGFKKGDKYADIDSLYVHKNYRNKGIGSALVKRCVDEARKAGYGKIIVSADSFSMDKLIRFYKKNGFKMLFVRFMKEVGDEVP